jgi:glutathione peroxidase-family protein
MEKISIKPCRECKIKKQCALQYSGDFPPCQKLAVELAQQHLTQQGSEPQAEICHCGSSVAWLNFRKTIQFVKFDFCPSCGKLLPC